MILPYACTHLKSFLTPAWNTDRHLFAWHTASEAFKFLFLELEE
jgi:hypothetical protein